MNSTQIAVLLVAIFFLIAAIVCFNGHYFYLGVAMLIATGVLVPVIINKED